MKAILNEGVIGMDIRVLQYFLAVAQEGSVTKAAESLHMSQPPLSRQMQELEKELERPLFKRQHKRMTLTEDGLKLYKRAEELVALMEKTKAEFAAPTDQLSGDIYIGCGETKAMALLARMAHELQTEYPNIHYQLYSGTARTILERMNKGLIDFGLLLEYVDISEYDFLRLPVTDRWGVLMPANSPLAAQEAVYAENLWDKPLIVSHQTAASTDMLHWLRRALSKLNIIATYNLLYNASLFVREGIGYAITLEGLISTGGDSGLCFRPLAPTLEQRLCIVWKKHHCFSSAADLFLKRMIDAFEENNTSSLGDET